MTRTILVSCQPSTQEFTVQKPDSKEQVVPIMTRICDELATIENEYALLVGGGDFRPRIEYFHDAVKCVTSQTQSSEQAQRLSVEALAYDVVTLRLLQDKPLVTLSPHAHGLSPKADLVEIKPDAIVTTQKRPDRKTRDRLKELYQHYGVLFSALLKPVADADYNQRTDDLNHEVEDIAAIIVELKKFKTKKGGNLEKLATLGNHLEHDELRMLLTTFIQKQSYKNKDDIDKLIAFLKHRSDQDDKDIRTVDDAHENYAMAQFGLYEQSKDMLKKMAESGVNLVGNFVESALRGSGQGRGR